MKLKRSIIYNRASSCPFLECHFQSHRSNPRLSMNPSNRLFRKFRMRVKILFQIISGLLFMNIAVKKPGLFWCLKLRTPPGTHRLTLGAIKMRSSLSTLPNGFCFCSCSLMASTRWFRCWFPGALVSLCGSSLSYIRGYRVLECKLHNVLLPIYYRPDYSEVCLLPCCFPKFSSGTLHVTHWKFRLRNP